MNRNKKVYVKNIPMVADPEFQKIIEQHAPHYVEFNLNPKDNSTTDCTIRAIGAAMGQSWDETFMELMEYGLKHKLYPNEESLYGIYLKDNGWKKHKMPTKRDGTIYLLKDFLKDFGDAAIVNVHNSHLTYIVDHKVYDTWDCSDQIVYDYWTHK